MTYKEASKLILQKEILDQLWTKPSRLLVIIWWDITSRKRIIRMGECLQMGMNGWASYNEAKKFKP